MQQRKTAAASAAAKTSSADPSSQPKSTPMPGISPNRVDSPLFSTARVPSKETIKFVVASCAKSAFVQTVMWLIMVAVSSVFGAIGSKRVGEITLNLLFGSYELVMISHAAIELFMSGAQQHQLQDQPAEKVISPKENAWDRAFHVALLAVLLGPFSLLYFASVGSIWDIALCLFCQWAGKALCFVSFPREIYAVGG
mmetsp:Transcript_7084/g.14241  ORF Transcript_7084/g.14241 Transcript_7084/m.14241 type:complete len:197 (-) Transcript_7084:218-808(-)